MMASLSSRVLSTSKRKTTGCGEVLAMEEASQSPHFYRKLRPFPSISPRPIEGESDLASLPQLGDGQIGQVNSQSRVARRAFLRRAPTVAAPGPRSRGQRLQAQSFARRDRRDFVIEGPYRELGLNLVHLIALHGLRSEERRVGKE